MQKNGDFWKCNGYCKFLKLEINMFRGLGAVFPRIRTKLISILYGMMKKSLKVFKLKAAILRLQFVKSMMCNSSYFDKSILNVYSSMSKKMFLGPAAGQWWPSHGHLWPSSGPAVAQQWPPVSPGLLLMTPGHLWWPLMTPGDSFLKTM